MNKEKKLYLFEIEILSNIINVFKCFSLLMNVMYPSWVHNNNNNNNNNLRFLQND